MRYHDILEILNNSIVKIKLENNRFLLDVKMEYLETNQIGTGGLNDLISRQEAVAILHITNQKIYTIMENQGINNVPLELENIQRTLDYAIWAIRELPCANEQDLEYTSIKPLKHN